MALSWNEIKERAVTFSKEYENDFNEDAEAKSFMDAFFNVFGVTRRRVASFETNIKKEDGKQGFIDLLWKGNILIEFKSKGKDLDKAHQQAIDYFPGLKDNELPKYILVSDFARFRLYDLEENKTTEFKLSELVKNVTLFGFIAGYQKRIYKEQDPVNIKAAELMGNLHDRLKEIGYNGHPLEVYLVRLLFCLFAEDTTIFNPQQFQDYIEQRTNIDGSDLASKLQELFQVLNTSPDKRFKNLDEQLAEFPYVNGKLFDEPLPIASFDAKMRQALLECCFLDWSKISPAIFGSMFQSVMNPTERRNLGAHYTSETNILKLIKPLFLDDLWKEFETIKDSKNKLPEFHKRLSTLRFLDPACGCGNFLVISYRELRLLELEILRQQYKNQTATSIESIIWLDVDMMNGIEFEEFPARIAEVAMWLIDHQMNMQISNEFGQYFVRLPLKKAANIVHGNALQIEWQSLLNPLNSIDVYAKHANIYLAEESKIEYKTLNVQTETFEIHKGKKPEQIDEIKFDYILGNPPFYGYSFQSKEQRADMQKIFQGIEGTGILDYVTAWYKKAAEYIQGTSIKVGFVSTNSITQGEQVSVLWNILLNTYNIKIQFAHRTFIWNNEAKGKAAVHCVIIGFSQTEPKEKTLFEYDNNSDIPHEIKVKNINPYLIEGRNIFVGRRTKPICKVPEMMKGSSPTDGGFLLLDNDQKKELLIIRPEVKIFIKKYVGSFEFINNIQRWCLWLKDADASVLKSSPEILERIKSVKEFRLKSEKVSTRKWAEFPTLFIEERQPTKEYIIVPRVSSENRKYIPIGYLNKDVIVSDSAISLPDATLFHFGVLTSIMHMAWIKYTCGRLKSDYRYSNTIVYNNYPWPENPTEKQIKAIEEKAQNILNVRNEFPKSSLANLYDADDLYPKLIKAHNELDKVVDSAYRPQPFTTEAKRMEFLFELYEKYTADLFTKEKTKKKK